MYKLAIFDMDGTLLDSIDDIMTACNRALAVENFPQHDRESYKMFVGRGVRNLILMALPPNTDDLSRQKVEDAFCTYYADHSDDMTRPYPGISEALRTLKDYGMKIAVLSNKPDVYTRLLSERFFSGLVDVAVGQRQGVPIKPDPTAVYHIMQTLDCSAEECVYVGDTGVDMQTGKNAGLTTMGVLWGFRTKNELIESGAVHIVDKSEQLVQMLIDK